MSLRWWSRVLGVVSTPAIGGSLFAGEGLDPWTEALSSRISTSSASTVASRNSALILLWRTSASAFIHTRGRPLLLGFEDGLLTHFTQEVGFFFAPGSG